MKQIPTKSFIYMPLVSAAGGVPQFSEGTHRIERVFFGHSTIQDHSRTLSLEWYVAFFSFNDKRRHLQTENVRAEEIVRCVSLLAVTRFMLGIKTQKRASTFQFPF